MWREQNNPNPKVFCAECAENHEFERRDPRFTANLIYGHQIGDLVPAMPNGKGGFWRYNRLAAEALEKWEKLPT